MSYDQTFEAHSPPPFLGAFDSKKIAFLPWHAALDLFFRPDIDWTATPSNTETPAFQHVLGLLSPILDANLVLFRFGDPDLPKFVRCAATTTSPTDASTLTASSPGSAWTSTTGRRPTPSSGTSTAARRALYCHYHAQSGALPDASLYDIRAHFQGFRPNGHMNPDSADPAYSSLIGDLRAAMKALAARIAPKVYQHGFLK